MSVILRKLHELCLQTIEKVNPRLESDIDFWYIDIASVDNTTKKIAEPTLTKGKLASVRARQLLRENDVLVSTTRPNLNAVAIVPEEYDSQIGSTGFCVLRSGDELDPEYLFYYTQSGRFVGSLTKLVVGALYPAVTDKQVYAQDIPWFPITTQRQIAARLKAQLAEVDKARQATEMQLRDASLLATRLREKLLNKLNQAPRQSLGELLLGIEAGKSFQTTELPARPDELGVLKVSAVSWDEFAPDEAKAIEDGYQPDEKHRVKSGDLIISRANTIELVGAVVRVEEDYPYRLLSDKTLRLVIDESRIMPDYLLAILKLPEARTHIENNATGTSDSMRNISQKTINKIPVPLIGLNEQAEFVRNANLISRELKKVTKGTQKQEAELEFLPQKILAQAFER